jgi:hypothetical protein
MKTILRATSPLLFLVVFAMPLFAQNPNVAIRIDAGKYCVKGALKNLRPTTIAVSYIELWIYDTKTCKRMCVTRKVINQKIKSCDTMDFDLCCANVPAALGDSVYYVRVHHSLGINEAWAFVP